ncbi:MAG: RluA family pseudouridine synthase [Candidatus Scalindua sp.]|nr:RluA family pseudouridine synthase [Candidatus Scalindua sp.]
MIVPEIDNSEHISFVVKKKLASKRIDKYLVSRRKLQDCSRSEIQRLIKEGNIKVNNIAVKSSYEIKLNDVISVKLPAKDKNPILPEDIPLDILYEDEHLIVINKTPDIVVHPARGNASGTLVNALTFYCNQLSSINGPLRPGIVHRLDRDTSGIILIIKNEKVHKHIALQFEKREIRKEYLAVVKGEIELDSDRIDLPIGRHLKIREKMAIRHDIGKKAVTVFEVIERFCGYTFVRVFPETGRTHQIRVHMKAVGHPIIADSAYGSEEACFLRDLLEPISSIDIQNLAKDQNLWDNALNPVIDRQALHACKINFFHPVLKKDMGFTAELPEDLDNLITILRKIKTINNTDSCERLKNRSH